MVLTILSFMPSDRECAQALSEARCALALICLYCGSRRVVKRGWRKRLSTSGIDVRTVGVGSTIGLGRSKNYLMGALTIVV